MKLHMESVALHIKHSLHSNGIKNQDLLEEMTDHYLTSYESYLETSHSKDEALQKTLGQINNLSGKELNRKIFMINHKNIISMSSLLFTFLLSVFYFTSFNASETFDPPLAWPLDISLHKVSSEYGLRIHPIHKNKKLHTGIDIRANYGQQVLATGNGTVIKSAYDDTHGHYIIIKHDDIYKSRFNHLAERLVDVNDKVAIGQVIAKVGSTGMSTAPHLHYEILKYDKAINPRELLKV